MNDILREQLQSELPSHRCRGKWSDPDFPHKGWEWLEVEDREGDDLICEMCEITPIRFAHKVSRDGTTLIVGCDCAMRMTEDYVLPRGREKSVRQYAQALSRWVANGWRTSAKGNSYKKYKGYIVVVYSVGSSWRIITEHRETSEKRTWPAFYEDREDAISAAFPLLLQFKSWNEDNNAED